LIKCEPFYSRLDKDLRLLVASSFSTFHRI
jgi:hypothetical protein